MKVVHIVLGKANPERMNGVSKVVHQLASHMHASGTDVEVWGITTTPESSVFPRAFTTRLFRQTSVFNPPDETLLKAIIDEQADTVFHLHGGFIPVMYKISRYLKLSGHRYVYTPHGSFNRIALKKNQWLKKLYISVYEKYLLQDAWRVQLLGQSEFDHLGKMLDLNNRVIVTNGQELGVEKSAKIPKYGIVFGFCGRLDSYYKGLDVLLQGFADYCHREGEGELWLIGDGPDALRLRNLTEDLGISNRVCFKGAMYGETKDQHLAAMDFFCHPSRSEGSPTAVLEAAAHGKPVMVTTATNVGKQVDQYHCGIHLLELSRDRIAEALEMLRNHYLQNTHVTMGKQSRLMVEREFSWQKVTQQLLDIYQQAKYVSTDCQ
jgi:glycosyltransferase involved in cell wall biosynthesis